MAKELSGRVDYVRETPWANCASVSLASVLPESLSGNEDLLGLAFKNDGTIDYMKRLLHVALYRQGYCPLAYESDDHSDIVTVLRDAYKDSRKNPFIEVFGAIVVARKIKASNDYHNAMDEYLADEAYRVCEFNPENYGTDSSETQLHLFSVVSVNSRAGRKKGGVVDTAHPGWRGRKLPRFMPMDRVGNQSMKLNPFFESHPIVSRGIRFEYLDHAHTGIPQSFWDVQLSNLDILSESARIAGRQYL